MSTKLKSLSSASNPTRKKFGSGWKKLRLCFFVISHTEWKQKKNKNGNKMCASATRETKYGWDTQKKGFSFYIGCVNKKCILLIF